MFGIKKERKIRMEINKNESKLIRDSLLYLRNKLIAEGKDASSVNELLIKIFA